MAVPIEDYAVLGDTRTAALVGPDGSLDWLCIPRFDGPPVFGQLVGGAAAGRFRLGAHRPIDVVTRGYRPESATLETTWQTDTGLLTLTEGMVAEVSGRLLPATMLVRRLTAADGPVEAVIDFDPGWEWRVGHRGRSTEARSWSAAGRPWPWACARPPPWPSSLAYLKS
jgi:trehalase-like protein